jgi:hypothetical protein
MTFPPIIPEDWAYDPPRILVVGDGPFPQVLAQVLQARLVLPGTLESEFPSGTSVKLPRVLSELSIVFVVVGVNWAAAEAAGINDAIWNWVLSFTEQKEDHLLAVQFVLPPCSGNGFRGALMASLALSGRDYEKAGFGFSCMSNGLSGILAVADRIIPKDYVALRNRRTSDIRRSALERFRGSVATGSVSDIKRAAESLAEVFFKEEHLLDMFCRKPSHRNGRRLRTFLNLLVTDTVTQDVWRSLSDELPEILI